MNFNSTVLRHGGIAVAAILAGMFAGAQAGAQTRDVTVVASSIPEDVRVAYVSYADLNLGNADGRLRLENRVLGAVRRVCPAGSPADLVAARLTADCRAAAWDGARAQMNAAMANAASNLAMRGAISVAARP